MNLNQAQPMPTGECWCGCGERARTGAFFVPGHDRKAEAAVVRLKYGSVAAFVKAHGYGPDGENLTDALANHEA